MKLWREGQLECKAADYVGGHVQRYHFGSAADQGPTKGAPFIVITTSFMEVGTQTNLSPASYRCCSLYILLESGSRSISERVLCW